MRASIRGSGARHRPRLYHPAAAPVEAGTLGGRQLAEALRADELLHLLERLAQRRAELSRARLRLRGGNRRGLLQQLLWILNVRIGSAIPRTPPGGVLACPRCTASRRSLPRGPGNSP